MKKPLANNNGNTSSRRGNLKKVFNDNHQKPSSGSTSRRRRALKTKSELDEEKIARSARIKERRRKASEKIWNSKPDLSKAEKMSKEDVERARVDALKTDPELERPENQWIRRAGWWGGDNGGSEAYESDVFADPSLDYDWWAQGYRMLGGYISCDDDAGSGDSGDGDGACSRWMMWAAYVNPNYGGGGRSEYFDEYENDGDNKGRRKLRKLCDEDYEDCDEYYSQKGVSKLDCHSPDTEWKLLGVYRQELYQFYEQISKHLWGYQDYEYVVALAGLAYMSDDDCFQVGYDDYGGYIYAGPRPKAGGELYVGLYTDPQCTILDTSGATYDDFGLQSEISLGSGDYYGYYGYDAIGFWENSQEYTFTNFNGVYEEYKYCTPCMDYPTYQDGYFIGDTGTDEDDLINQCWKFHSHDSYTCDSACLAMGDAQGTITQIQVGERFYGASWYGSTSKGQDTTYDHYSKQITTKDEERYKRMQSIKANFFIVFCSVLFVATYLAYSSSRVSHKKIKESSKSSKAQPLLSSDDVSDLPRLSSRKSSQSFERHGSSSRKKSSSRMVSNSTDEFDNSTSFSAASSHAHSTHTSSSRRSRRKDYGHQKAYSSRRRSKVQDDDVLEEW
eukprot:CAMPEP_0184865850 /NCGR_PEP_ID=MMETSP0580-20130426/19420_1 /TAXON_ID=1118495 /ORGANISM="Dactyliosolen fragilissimus" /LENGTH=616 /DNA_ID=CAMNT_0027365221 /DNA_START=217 /DNA_END=2067 /DNA_ORIENTATION=+